MPRMLRVAPYLGYIVIAGAKAAEPKTGPAGSSGVKSGEAPVALPRAKVGDAAKASARLDEGQRLAAVEDARTDVTARNYAEAIAALKDAAADGNEAEKSQARTALARYEPIQAALNAYTKALAEGKEKIEDLKKEYEERIAKIGPAKHQPIDFAFTGWLDTTGKYLINRPGTHKLIKGDKIECFLVVPEGSKINLNRYFQKMVGVLGKVHDAPAGWNAYKVVEVEEIDELQEK